jgi:hypothetical protein
MDHLSGTMQWCGYIQLLLRDFRDDVFLVLIYDRISGVV